MILSSIYIKREEFEILKATTDMMKDNLEKNIDWFYGSLAVMIAVTSFGLFAVVQKATRDGIERGIEEANNSIKSLVDKRQPFGHASGNGMIQSGKFIIGGIGLDGFSMKNFINLTISDLKGNVLYTADTIKINENKIIEVDFRQYPDFYSVYYSIIWLRQDYIELRKSENE